MADFPRAEEASRARAASLGFAKQFDNLRGRFPALAGDAIVAALEAEARSRQAQKNASGASAGGEPRVITSRRHFRAGRARGPRHRHHPHHGATDGS